jgi:hypothetical protein
VPFLAMVLIAIVGLKVSRRGNHPVEQADSR